jgi:protoporphyrinogen oxidase
LEKQKSVQSRRRFLQTVFGLLSAGYATQACSLMLSAAAAQTKTKSKAKPGAAPAVKPKSGSNPNYKISQWTGDDFKLGHMLRDGMPAKTIPKNAEREVEFVIIGGGIAGLSSAYYLKDHDFLLLEQYSELGGQSRGGTYRGIDYSIGAAYINGVEGVYGQLYSDLGIKPEPLPEAHNAWFWDGRWYTHLSDKEEVGVYKDFKRLMDEAAPVFKILPTEDSPQSVVGDLEKLDSVPFAAHVKGYSPKFVSLLNNICKSSCCGDIQQLSALSGYLLIADIKSQNYVFKGGNAAISKALVSKLNAAGSSRLLTDTFVWKVEGTGSGASVIYSDKSGEMHRVNCKHVIVSSPPLVASRIISDMTDEMKAQLLGMKYGSYLVANCLMKKKLFSQTYDNFVCSPFTFADIVIAETPYQLSDSYKPDMGSVLTVYQPYTPGSEGRPLLFVGDRKQFASSIYEQISKLVDHLDANLEEIVLTRWGHAMVVSGPNYFRRLRKVEASYNSAPFTLAHNSTQGLPCAESAIRAALFATARAKKMAAG